MIWLLVAGVVLAFGFVAFTGAPYLPSRRSDVRQAFDDLYKLKSDDVLVDIGSGDGVVLREAARRGARAIGYEIHPILVLVSRWLSRSDPKVTVRLANFWRTPLPDDVTVVYVFGDGRDIEKMVNYVQREVDRLGRGVSLISYGFSANEKPSRRAGAYNLYNFEPKVLRKKSQ